MKNKENIIIHKPNQLIEITGNPVSTLGLLTYNFLLHRFQQEKTDSLIFSPNEIFEALEMKDNYKELYSFLDSLQSIRILSKDKKGKLWGAFNLLAEFRKEEQGIFVQIPNTIFKALCGEEGQELYYTTIKLLEEKAFKCSHSIIFYEIFKKYEKVNIPCFTVDEIREMTKTLEKYSSYYDFKRYVLEKALEEINKFDKKYNYTYEVKKLGKTVNKIQFIKEHKIVFEEKEVIFSNELEKEIEKARKNRFIDAIYAHKSMQKILEQYDEKDIIKALREAIKYNSEILNFSKFLISKIKDIQNSKKSKTIKKAEKIETPKELTELEIQKGEVAKIIFKSKPKEFKLFEVLEEIDNLENLEQFKLENF